MKTPHVIGVENLDTLREIVPILQTLMQDEVEEEEVVEVVDEEEEAEVEEDEELNKMEEEAENHWEHSTDVEQRPHALVELTILHLDVMTHTTECEMDMWNTGVESMDRGKTTIQWNTEPC